MSTQTETIIIPDSLSDEDGGGNAQITHVSCKICLTVPGYAICGAMVLEMRPPGAIGCRRCREMKPAHIESHKD